MEKLNFMIHSFIKLNFIIVFIIILIFTNKCDHGLAPPEPEVKMTGISGTIFYQHWPAADSLYDLRLVIFQNYPPDSILSEVMNGRAVVYPAIGEPSLTCNIDTAYYLVELSPASYQYIVVAQQYKPNFQEQASWRVVGQYDTTLTDTLPTAVNVIQDSILEKIDIYVDFDHLPIQPF
jgi:hypothetical protein